MDWQEVGTVSLDGSAFAADVGTVSLPATGGLEIRVQQLNPPDDAPYRAGLMYIRTATGRTLGTRKFWGHPEGEDYALGTLLSAEESSGTLVVEPRYLNLKALKAGRIWRLRFWARPASAAGGGSGGGGGGGGGSVAQANTIKTGKVVSSPPAEIGAGPGWSGTSVSALLDGNPATSAVASAAGPLSLYYTVPAGALSGTIEVDFQMSAIGNYGSAITAVGWNNTVNTIDNAFDTSRRKVVVWNNASESIKTISLENKNTTNSQTRIEAWNLWKDGALFIAYKPRVVTLEAPDYLRYIVTGSTVTTSGGGSFLVTDVAGSTVSIDDKSNVDLVGQTLSGALPP